MVSGCHRQHPPVPHVRAATSEAGTSCTSCSAHLLTYRPEMATFPSGVHVSGEFSAPFTCVKTRPCWCETGRRSLRIIWADWPDRTRNVAVLRSQSSVSLTPLTERHLPTDLSRRHHTIKDVRTVFFERTLQKFCCRRMSFGSQLTFDYMFSSSGPPTS